MAAAKFTSFQPFLYVLLFLLLLLFFFSACTGEELIEESGSGDGGNVSCPVDSVCSDLPYHCIACNHDNGSCEYGQETTFTCGPIEGVMCDVREREREDINFKDK